MIDHKNINKFITVLVVLAILCLTAFLLWHGNASASAGSGLTMGYETSLFNTKNIIDIDVSISDDDWNDLLENPTDETYYTCDVTVNGTTYSNVGFRAKGNTSLSMVASSDSDRYSFKIKFDKYDDNQTCDGLTSLVLNNNYSDATMMKEALTYDMFQYLGADSSLYNYAKVSVNGEYYGVYLALEPVDDSFAMRNYGSDYGNLYKPDSMNMGGVGKMNDFSPSEVKDAMGMDSDSNSNSDSTSDSDSGANPSSDSSDSNRPTPPDFNGNGTDGKTPPDFGNNSTDGNTPAPPDFDKNTDSQNKPGADGFDKPDGQGGPGGKGGQKPDGGFGSSDSSANLNYIDDDLDSYETIWDGSVFKSSDSDHQKVVTALKNICSEDASTDSLAEYMDVDNVLRYMAVQTFVVNLDSLTGNMAHNYYLYEKDSQLNIIPWDYNLSYGGFQSGSADDVINFPIDTPFSENISLEDRQFFMALLNNETYLAQYHEYLSQLVEYVQNGQLDTVYDRITSQIDNLVKTDPTSFYTYDEYTSAKEMLKETISLRAESIQGQLDGTIPSTWDGQSENSSSLIDASSIDLSVMGVQGGGQDGGPNGGGSGNRPGGGPNGNNQTGETNDNSQNGGAADGGPGKSQNNQTDSRQQNAEGSEKQETVNFSSAET